MFGLFFCHFQLSLFAIHSGVMWAEFHIIEDLLFIFYCQKTGQYDLKITWVTECASLIPMWRKSGVCLFYYLEPCHSKPAICCKVQTMMLLSMKFSPAFCCFITLNILLSTLFLNIFNLYSLLTVRDHIWYLYKEQIKL